MTSGTLWNFRRDAIYATLARPASCRQTAMAEKKRESMSSVDVAWLRMDRPSNLMVICGVLAMDERIPMEPLRSTVASRFLRYPRFRQRPVNAAGGYHWQSDEDFNLAHHGVRIELPS